MAAPAPPPTTSENASAASTHLRPGPAGGHLAAAGGFAALTVAFLWPAVAHFDDRVLSAGGDGSTFLWAYWAMPRALLRLSDPFTTDLLFHPVGADLAFHTTTPLAMVLSWPVARLLGLGAAVNALQLAAVFLSALGAYLLAFRVCGDRRAAFFAGAAFAFVPYRFVHMGGHFNLIHVEFLPFGLLAFLRFLDEPSRRRAAWIGAAVGLTFLTDFYLTVFLSFALAGLALLNRHRIDRAAVSHLSAALAVCTVVALPLLVPMIRALLGGELDPLPGWGGADRYATDAAAWVLPPSRHPWWGSATARAHRELSAGGEGLAYPGLLVLCLALATMVGVAWPRRRPWAVLAAGAGIMAMGPFLQVAGHTGGLFSYLGRSFSVPLPYLAVHFVPVLSSVRVPGRFAIVAVLALDVLAACTLADIARRRPRWAWPVLVGALAVTLVEFLPGRLDTHRVAAPKPYRAIAADTGAGAVLEVPLQWQSAAAQVGDRHTGQDHTIFMYYATVHGRPLVSGYVARYPAERLKRLTSIPVYRQVLALADEPGFDDPATFGAEELRRLGIGYVVYHRDRPRPAVHAYLAGLGLPVLADDGTVVVWKVPG